MSYIPAEYFKNPAQGLMVLEVIDAISHIVPRQDPSSLIPDANRARLSVYNRRAINREITGNNIEDETKKLYKSKDKFNQIAVLKKELNKYASNINVLRNRFLNTKDKVLEGVGIDGAGDHPKNFTQERLALTVIRDGAERFDKWPGFVGTEEKILEESLGNMTMWQAVNMAQLPIGTPVQVSSAVIGLLSPDTNPDPAVVNFLQTMTGEQLVRMRPECEGLRYLLEGNKLDLGDGSFNGVSLFNSTIFGRFFKGAHTVSLKVNGVNGNQWTFKDLDDNSLFADAIKNRVSQLYNKDAAYYGGSTDEPARTKFGMIMYIYAIFFFYCAYIYNLYDQLIVRITDGNLRMEYEKARLLMVRNFLRLVNLAIVKHFKLQVNEDEIDELIIVADKEEVAGGNFVGGYEDGLVKYRLIPNKLTSVLKATKTNNFSDFTVGFKDPDMYLKLIQAEGSYDKDAFTVDKYPLVFNREHAVGVDQILSVDYRQSIERLTKFLLMDGSGSLPKTSTGLVAVGANMQNDEIFQSTAEVLDGFYSEMGESKAVYLQYMEMKVHIFESGISSREVINLRDYLLGQFTLIGTTLTTPQQKDLECVRLVNKILDEYKRLRKEELRLTDDKTLFVAGRRRNAGNRIEDLPRQMYRAMRRVKAGTEAVIRLEVAKLTYMLFMNRNPGVMLCNNFMPLLMQKSAEIDMSMNMELSRMMDKKMVELERKYGANALKSIIKQAQVITMATIPPSPQGYLAAIGQMFSSVASRTPGQPMPMIPGGPAAMGGPIGKRDLTLEQRLRVEQRKFWEDLKTAMSGKTLLLPVAKLTRSSVFEDSSFYMVDIFRSMMFNRLDRVSLRVGDKITEKGIYGRLQQRGYLLVNAQTPELANPAQWRAVSHTSLMRMVKSGDGTYVFKNIRKARDIFFNLIANTSFLTDSMSISIPEASRTSLSLVKYCSNVLKKELPKCNILISRQQFGQTVQGKMEASSGTKGIDVASGMSYAEFSAGVSLGEDDIVRR